jgi:rhodanese-related sulfurtransferase
VHCNALKIGDGLGLHHCPALENHQNRDENHPNSEPSKKKVALLMTQVENLDYEDIKQGLAEGRIIVIDVREANEFAAGHIPGARLNALSVFDPSALPVGEGKRIVLSCRSGKRSLTAAGLAHAAGIAIDAHYAGGMLDWVAQGGPVAH